MIFRLPPKEAPVDQGDIFEECPLLQPTVVDLDNPDPVAVKYALSRVIVLTQTCDLANRKTGNVRSAVRALRVYGLYFLPKMEAVGLPELIVDLRQLHTVRIEVLIALCQRGKRRAGVQPLYREHLAKHFADTYSRIGLPESYDTE